MSLRRLITQVDNLWSSSTDTKIDANRSVPAKMAGDAPDRGLPNSAGSRQVPERMTGKHTSKYGRPGALQGLWVPCTGHVLES
jgi:hypothetical protein